MSAPVFTLCIQGVEHSVQVLLGIGTDKSNELWYLSWPERVATPLLQAKWTVRNALFSPDGRCRHKTVRQVLEYARSDCKHNGLSATLF
jgi:hypothetical protein